MIIPRKLCLLCLAVIMASSVIVGQSAREELQEKPLWPLMPHQPYGLLKLMQDIFIDPTKYLKNIQMKQ